MDSLAAMTRQQADVLSRLGRLGEGLQCIAPTIAAIAGRFTGQPVRLRVVVPASVPDCTPELPGPGFEGVAARLRCVDPPSDCILLVPGSLCDILADAVLGGGSQTGLVEDSILLAVVTHVVADVLRALPATLPVVRLAGVTTLTAADAPMFDGQDTVVHLKVRVGSLHDLVTLVLGRQALDAVQDAPWIARLLRSRNAAGALRVPASLVVGTADLTLQQLASLEVSDVVILDRASLSEPPGSRDTVQECDLGIAGASRDVFLARVQLGGSEARVVEGGPMLMEGEMNREDDLTVVDDRETPAGGHDDAVISRLAGLDARVVVEAGRVSVSVEELLSLSAGTVLSLDRPASAEVTLTVGGRELAHGVLVVVEGELGVRVLKVLR